MDPATLTAIGGSIISGLFGRASEARQRRWAVEDVNEQFVRLRAAAEKAGYNPLAVLGAGSGIPAAPAASANYMGSAIADSALMIADNIAKDKNKAQTLAKVNQLTMQNAELQKQLTKATLRPKVGGVYAARETPADYHSALGASNAPVDPVVDAGGPRVPRPDAPYGPFKWRLKPLLNLDPFDPRREVQPAPVVDEGGFSVVDNPLTGRFRIPSVNGETVDIWQLPVIAGSYAVDKAASGASDYWNGKTRFWPDFMYTPAPSAVRFRNFSGYASGERRQPFAFNPPAMGRTVSPRYPLGF